MAVINIVQPWWAARELERDLARGLEPADGAAPPTLPDERDSGERVLQSFPRYGGRCPRYERLVGSVVVPDQRPIQAVFGSPGFVAGAVLGATVTGIRTRRKARELSSPQWLERRVSDVVVTTHRLYCLDDTIGWLHFTYNVITGFGLDARTFRFVLDFHNAPSLRLTGAWAPWIAVAVAYYALGAEQARSLPDLDPLRRRSARTSSALFPAPARPRC